MEFRRILCPIDFSEGSRAALEQALELARSLGASLEILHVYHLPSHASNLTAPHSVEELEPEVRTSVEQALADFTRELDARDVQLSRTLEVGVPYQAIANAADQRADLVVMSTLGRTGMQRLLLGSVAERVVRLCSVPVITVPSPAESS